MVLGEVVAGAVVNASAYVPTELEPVLGAVRGFFVIASSLLGGLFGLYFIFMLLRFFYDRKILKEVRLLKTHITHLEKKLDKPRRKR